MQIVLSNSLKEYKEYLKSFKIIEEKSILLKLINEILKKIYETEGMAFQDLYILTNCYKEENINLIRNIAPKVRSVTIITKEISKYKIIEEMMQENGIPIVIANNKRKSLKKANMIINLDFKQKELKEYIINRNSIILNFTEEKLMKLNGFEGVVIQNVRNMS